MVIEQCVGKRNELPVAAIGAFDARLLANTGEPFVSTGRRIASFATGLALPPYREYVLAAAEKLLEQTDLLRGAQSNLFMRCRCLILWRRRLSPFDPIGVKQSSEPRVFPLQLFNSYAL